MNGKKKKTLQNMLEKVQKLTLVYNRYSAVIGTDYLFVVLTTASSLLRERIIKLNISVN